MKLLLNILTSQNN